MSQKCQSQKVSVKISHTKHVKFACRSCRIPQASTLSKSATVRRKFGETTGSLEICQNRFYNSQSHVHNCFAAVAIVDWVEKYIDPNINDRDHLVRQLTNVVADNKSLAWTLLEF